jgi:hypothetical protein
MSFLAGVETRCRIFHESKSERLRDAYHLCHRFTSYIAVTQEKKT